MADAGSNLMATTSSSATNEESEKQKADLCKMYFTSLLKRSPNTSTFNLIRDEIQRLIDNNIEFEVFSTKVSGVQNVKPLNSTIAYLIEKSLPAMRRRLCSEQSKIDEQSSRFSHPNIVASIPKSSPVESKTPFFDEMKTYGIKAPPVLPRSMLPPTDWVMDSKPSLDTSTQKSQKRKRSYDSDDDNINEVEDMEPFKLSEESPISTMNSNLALGQLRSHKDVSCPPSPSSIKMQLQCKSLGHSGKKDSMPRDATQLVTSTEQQQFESNIPMETNDGELSALEAKFDEMCRVMTSKEPEVIGSVTQDITDLSSSVTSGASFNKGIFMNLDIMQEKQFLMCCCAFVNVNDFNTSTKFVEVENDENRRFIFNVVTHAGIPSRSVALCQLQALWSNMYKYFMKATVRPYVFKQSDGFLREITVQVALSCNQKPNEKCNNEILAGCLKRQLFEKNKQDVQALNIGQQLRFRLAHTAFRATVEELTVGNVGDGVCRQVSRGFMNRDTIIRVSSVTLKVSVTSWR